MVPPLSSPPPRRAACSDAERRLALTRLAELRAAGRDAVLEAEWVRPRTELAAALHAVLGVAASLVAVGAPLAGVLLAFVAVASATSDAVGGPALLRRLTPLRATQSLLAPAPAAGAPVVRARLDAPRRGLAARIPFAPVVPVALLGVLATAIARGLEVEERWLSVVQLVPTALLLLSAYALLDVALGAPDDDRDATAVAVAAGLGAGATILLHGAGEEGRRAHERRHRPPPTVRWVDAAPDDDPAALAARLRSG